MTLEELIARLQELLAEHPDAGDAAVLTADDWVEISGARYKSNPKGRPTKVVELW
jgi:hypothetical protein